MKFSLVILLTLLTYSISAQTFKLKELLKIAKCGSQECADKKIKAKGFFFRGGGKDVSGTYYQYKFTKPDQDSIIATYEIFMGQMFTLKFSDSVTYNKLLSQISKKYSTKGETATSGKLTSRIDFVNTSDPNISFVFIKPLIHGTANYEVTAIVSKP